MPTRSDIENALRTPDRFAPAIHRLGGGMIATNRRGEIALLEGDNAVVARLETSAGQVIALRMPLADDGDPLAVQLHARFATDPVIASLRSRTPSPVAGGVSVIPMGLQLPGSRNVPVIAMEWVGDLALDEAVEQIASSRDLVRMSALGTQFQRMMTALAAERFSHGNLIPENILLRRGDAMAVVDYDTAAWPGSPRGRNDRRVPAYSHPSGAAPLVLERRDDFAALVIVVSLRLLSFDLRFLSTAAPSAERGMVFDLQDLRDPNSSERFRRASVVDDAETVALTAILAEACRKPVDETPPFEDTVRAAKAVSGRIRRGEARAEQAPESERTREAHVVSDRLDPRERQGRITRLNAMLMRGADAEAVAYWEASGLQHDAVARESSGALVASAKERLSGKVKPIEIAPPVVPEDPRRSGWRVISTGASMARLETAIANNDREAALNEWADVQDTPGASRYAATVHHFATDYWSGAIRQAARRGDAGGVLEAVKQADAAGVPIPANLRPMLREAAFRAEKANRSTDPMSWASAHPELAHALERDDDRVISASIEASGNEDFSDLPDLQRARVELALRRIAWALDVRRALRRRNQGHLDQLLSQPVPGAERLLSVVERSRIERIGTRAAAQSLLNEALRGHDDRSFIQAMRQIEATGAQLPSNLDAEAFNGALERITRVTALRRAVQSGGGQDARTVARLVPAAVIGGVDWGVIERLVKVEDVDRELIKLGRVARIREALQTEDPDRIVAAALPDTHGALAELTPAERAQVETAAKQARPLPGVRQRVPDSV